MYIELIFERVHLSRSLEYLKTVFGINLFKRLKETVDTQKRLKDEPFKTNVNNYKI